MGTENRDNLDFPGGCFVHKLNACLFYIFACIRDLFLYKSFDSGESRSDCIWGKLTAQLRI